MLGARQPGEWRVASANTSEAWILARRRTGDTTPPSVPAPGASATVLATLVVDGNPAAPAPAPPPPPAAATTAPAVLRAAEEEPTAGPAILLDSWGVDMSVRLGRPPVATVSTGTPARHTVKSALQAVGPAREAAAAPQSRPTPATTKHREQGQYRPTALAPAPAPAPAPVALANSPRPRVSGGNRLQLGRAKQAAQFSSHDASKHRAIVNELQDSLPAIAAATGKETLDDSGSWFGGCSAFTALALPSCTILPSRVWPMCFGVGEVRSFSGCCGSHGGERCWRQHRVCCAAIWCLFCLLCLLFLQRFRLSFGVFVICAAWCLFVCCVCYSCCDLVSVLFLALFFFSLYLSYISLLTV